MRPNQSTLKGPAVHAYARHLLLQVLDKEPHRPVLPLRLVGSVLILAACWRTSLTGACDLVKDGPCHRHVRKALYACLPSRPRDLLSRLLQALRETLPDDLFYRPQVMALDLHQRPYYGKKGTKGSTKKQKKASTRKAFTYATLAALDGWGGRFTVGLLPFRPHMRLGTVVGQLLEQAGQLGLRVSYLLLDKEFYAAEVVDLLQRRGVPFLMPAVKKGSKGRGNSHLFEPACRVGWHDYAWTTRVRRTDFATMKRYKGQALTVRVRVCVASRPKGGRARRGKGDEPLVYASWGLGKDWSPALVVQAYRRRFGIEVQYRQLGQCLARTSSRSERLRLLLVGLAVLLCNLWAYLHAEAFSRGPRGGRERQLGLMRLAQMVVAVAEDVAALFGGFVSEFPTQRPPPAKLAMFLT